MCCYTYSNLEDNINEFSKSVLEALNNLKNVMENYFKRDNKEKDINYYIDELGEVLLSHKDLSFEFGAFAVMASYLEYLFIKNPQKLKGNEEFVDKVFATFSNLLEAKLNYLVKRDEASKEEYDKQYSIYRKEYNEYRLYFNGNIYEPTHKYDDICDAIGRILIED